MSFQGKNVSKYVSSSTKTDSCLVVINTNKIAFYFSFGGVNQASKITGPKRRPSQSPSMRLLSMLHIHDDPEGIPTYSVLNYNNSFRCGVIF